MYQCTILTGLRRKFLFVFSWLLETLNIFFVYLLAIYVSSFDKSLFYYFAHLFMGYLFDIEFSKLYTHTQTHALTHTCVRVCVCTSIPCESISPCEYSW